MAKALQCPQCSFKHRITTLGPLGKTIECQQCGQLLRVPEAFRARESVAAPTNGRGIVQEDDVAGVGAERTLLDVDRALVAEPIEDRRAAVRAAGAAFAANGTMVVGVSEASPQGDPRASGVQVSTPSLARLAMLDTRSRPRTILDRTVVKLLVWIAAFAVGAVVVLKLGTGWGYLSKERGLEIVNGSGLMDRYSHVAILVVIWAAVTATLVQIICEGGRALVLHLQTSRGSTSEA